MKNVKQNDNTKAGDFVLSFHRCDKQYLNYTLATLIGPQNFEKDRHFVIELSVKTTKRTQAINITSQVAHAIWEKEGSLLHIYTPHTTCGLLVNEEADPNVIRDIMASLDRMVPADCPYTHLEGNSDAHIKAVLTGSSVSIPLSGGTLKLGTWQGIFLMEFDGPRERKVVVTLI
jgi:secondary thiamine-phosphate synthase enzyme